MRKKLLSVMLILCMLVTCFDLQAAVMAANNFTKEGKPAASVESGTYTSVQQVELTASNGGAIYYTLDGTVPDKNDTLYAGPIEVGTPYENTSVTLKAVSYLDGKYSELAVYDYVINAKRNMVAGVIPAFAEGVTAVNTNTGEAADEALYKLLTDGVYGDIGIFVPGNEWITFDFGEVAMVNEIIAVPYYNWGLIYDLRIELSKSADFSDAYTVYRGAANTYRPATEKVGEACVFRFPVYPTEARYVRISNNGGNNQQGQGVLTDLIVYEGNRVLENTNLALGKKVTGEEGYQIGFESNIDKNLVQDLNGLTKGFAYDNTYMSVTKPDPANPEAALPAYVQIDLEREFEIGKIGLINTTFWDWGSFQVEFSRTADFAESDKYTVDTSNLVKWPGENRGAEVNAYEKEVETTARYVRVTSDRGGLMTEIRVFPKTGAVAGDLPEGANVIERVIPTFEEGVTPMRTMQGDQVAGTDDFLALTDGVYSPVGIFFTGNTWVTFDFGKLYTVNEVIAVPYYNWDLIYDLRIELSATPDFADAYVVSRGVDSVYRPSNDSSGGASAFRYPIYPTEARYVRISNNGNNGNPGQGVLTDLIVKKGATVPENVNVALAKPVTADPESAIGFEGSDSHMIKDLSGLTDGLSYDNTYLTITKDGTPSYAQIDLLQEYDLGVIGAVSHTSWDWASFRIETSLTADFSDAQSFTMDTSNRTTWPGENRGTDVNAYELKLNVRARYVRITSERSGLLTEIRVIPKDALPVMEEGVNVLQGLMPILETGAITYPIEGGSELATEEQLKQTTDGILDADFNGISTTSEWITYDMGKVYSLTKVVASIYSTWENIYNLNIQLAKDAGFTEDVYHVVSRGQGAYLFANRSNGGRFSYEFNFNPVEARYIRISNTGNTADGSTRLRELQAYTGTRVAGGANVALGKTVVRDEGITYLCAENGSAATEEHLGNVTNGRISNWGLSVGPLEWITIDLQQVYSVDSVMFSAYPDWPDIVNIRVQLSETADFADPYDVYYAEAGTTLANNYTDERGKFGYLFEFAPVRARYVRVANSANEVGKGTLLSEIQVFTAAQQVEEEDTATTVLMPPAERTLTVKNGAKLEDVLAELGAQLEVRDNEGNIYTVDVSWHSDDFTAGAAATYTFIGTLSNLPEGVKDLYEIQAMAKVTVLAAVDFSALNEALTAYADVESGNYTGASYAAFKASYDAAAALVGTDVYQEEVDAALADLQAKYEALVDFSELKAAVTAAREVPNDNYTPSSWNALQSAISGAEKLLANDAAVKSQVERAIIELEAAEAGLTAQADKSSLIAKIGEMENVTDVGYTIESFARFEDALLSGRELVENQNATPEQVAAAVTAIENAYAGLTMAADKSRLNAAITAAKELSEADYTSDTFALFAEALAAAEAVAADPNAVDEDVTTMLELLSERTEALIRRGDKSQLNSLIERAQAIEKSGYTTASYAALKEILASAKEVAAQTDALTDAVNAAAEALDEALSALVKRGDKTQLTGLIADKKSADEYTAATYAVYLTAYDSAVAVNNNVDATEDEVSAAVTALNAAIASLNRVGDKTALQVAVDEAKALSLAGYTAESKAAFQNALGDAESVLAYTDASEADITRALDALNAAREGLTANADGCNSNCSSSGVTALLLAVVLCVGVSIKKLRA